MALRTFQKTIPRAGILRGSTTQEEEEEETTKVEIGASKVAIMSEMNWSTKDRR